jgi:hypothetical protein
MMLAPIQQKTIFSLFVFIIFLIVLEIVLNIIHFYKIPAQQFEISRNNNTFRILTLGESTTDDFGVDGVISWPRQLEKMLTSKNYNVKVYNLGKSATTSNAILNNIDEYLELFQPQLVISMMGINDSNQWIINLPNTFIGRLKIYRLYTYLIHLIKIKLSYKYIDDIDDKGIASEVKIKYKPLYYDEKKLHNILQNKSLSEKAQIRSALACNIFNNVGLDESSETDKIVNLEIALSSIQDGYYTICAFGTALQLLAKLNRCDEVIRQTEKFITKGGLLETRSLVIAQDCFNESNLSQLLNQNQEMLSLKHIKHAPTKENYLNLNTRITNLGATHILMQYPTLQNNLNQYVENPRLSIIHYNYESFKTALKTNKYYDIFVDQFAGEFGHCTNLGNSIIANSLLPKVVAIIDQKLN